MSNAKYPARSPTGFLEQSGDSANVGSTHTLIQGLNIADQVVSTPSERSAEALAAALETNALVECILTMRADIRDKHDTTKKLQDLYGSLHEILRQISSIANAQPYERSCKDAASHTSSCPITSYTIAPMPDSRQRRKWWPSQPSMYIHYEPRQRTTPHEIMEFHDGGQAERSLFQKNIAPARSTSSQIRKRKKLPSGPIGES